MNFAPIPMLDFTYLLHMQVKLIIRYNVDDDNDCSTNIPSDDRSRNYQAFSQIRLTNFIIVHGVLIKYSTIVFRQCVGRADYRLGEAVRRVEDCT